LANTSGLADSNALKRLTVPIEMQQSCLKPTQPPF
jgi:hypothetical protein